MSNTQIKGTTKRKKYPTDISDNGWKHLKKLLPAAKSNKQRGGRPVEVDRREIINGIFYVVKSGCPCVDFPKLVPADSRG